MGTSIEPTPELLEDTPLTVPPKEENFLAEIVRFTVVALLIVIPIRMFIAQPFIVQGASMDPTFHTDEYVIVDQLTYHFDEPKRGDVIVFKYPKEPSKFFIKRIIGIPGDTLTIEGRTVVIFNAENPNGFTLSEPYIADMRPEGYLTETLGEHEYFVMGDNRNASSDSRAWGVLRDNMIVGRAFVRLLPVTRASILPGSISSLDPS